MNEVKTFLDEGFDFIEESVSEVPLEFVETDKDIIVESKDNVQRPFHILGVCKGVFQPINEPSRNFRMYDPDHWQYQISKPELQERLQNRQMLGQIGHRDSRVDDLTISRGEVSHVVTMMEVREDANGKPYLYGELEILDTPAGRILKGLYEGGVGLYISSRGAGKLEPMPEQFGQDSRMKRVSKTSFFLETWDIVKAPGFLKARPVYESAVSEDKKEAVYESHDTTELDVKPSVTSEAQEITQLKSQIDKLAKIVEKVVDDVYEEPTNEAIADELEKRQDMSDAKKDQLKAKAEVAQKAEEEAAAKREGRTEQEILNKRFKTANKEGEYKTSRRQCTSEAMSDFISLMAMTNISEEAFEEIIDLLVKAQKANMEDKENK